MATVTPHRPGTVATNPLPYLTAQAGGDQFAASPGARYLVHFKNGHTSSQSVVVDDPTSQDPGGATQFNPDVTHAVPNAGERVWIINRPERFRAADGFIKWTYSGTTALTFQVYEIL